MKDIRKFTNVIRSSIICLIHSMNVRVNWEGLGINPESKIISNSGCLQPCVEGPSIKLFRRPPSGCLKFVIETRIFDPLGFIQSCELKVFGDIFTQKTQKPLLLSIINSEYSCLFLIRLYSMTEIVVYIAQCHNVHHCLLLRRQKSRLLR